MKIHTFFSLFLHSTAFLALLFIAGPAYAADSTIDSGDTAWILVSSLLVLFMTLPGLALFYGGLVRSKNVLSVLMQCFAIASTASLLWVLVGYKLSFGHGGPLNAFIGELGTVLVLEHDAMSGSIPEALFIMFQMTFAIITPALIVGGFAERMRFAAMLLFSILWSLAVYYPICHMIWGGGWLHDIGLLEFAGGTVVHLTAGIAALIAALMLGVRKGFPVRKMAPHNLTMTVMGAAMLWVGWFGFNAGSAVSANNAAAMAMLATQLSAAAAALAWMLCEWVKFGKPSALGIVTGSVAGLVAVTPASGFIGPVGGIVIGLVGGYSCFFVTQLIKRRFLIDDSLDVFAVHGTGGLIGTLLIAVFASTTLGGVGLEKGMLEQMGIQLTAALFVILWTIVATYACLQLTKLVTPLRVKEKHEEVGLDITEHEETGYSF